MKQNIFFLLIDTLREDEFKKFCDLHPDSNFSKLLDQGIYFKNCISSGDATLLSLSSMFTGLFPNKNGISSEKLYQLNPNVKTFFHTLKYENFNFYGYFPTVVDLSNIIPKFKNDDSGKYSFPCITKEIGDKILTQLKNLTEPWFFYAHCMDLHDPITIQKNLDDKEITSLYQKQIMAIDTVLTNIVKEIDFTKTLFIVCSDHGTYLKESYSIKQNISLKNNSTLNSVLKNIGGKIPSKFNPLKDKIFYNLVENKHSKDRKKIQNLSLTPYEKRNLLTQKFDLEHELFDELIKIPLVITGCGLKNNVVENQVRSIDIFPTILSILKINIDLKNIDGINLINIINKKSDEDLIAYFQTNPLLSFKSSDSVGLRLNGFKYFRDKNNAELRVHLYDLKNDPFENNNIYAQFPEKLTQLENRLKKFLINETDISENKKSDLIENELKKLGYV